MAKQDPAAQTLAALDRAIAGGKLPPEVAERARILADRLRAPVRVTLAGLPGSGKSTALNLLAGADFLPTRLSVQSHSLPTLRLRQGGTDRASLTLTNGSQEEVVGADAAPEALAARDDLAFVDMTHDLPALGRVSLMEIVSKADDVAQIKAATWAAPRTDITIWVSRTWTPREQNLWSNMPERMRANAILLRSHADQATGGLPVASKSIQRAAGDTFDRAVAADLVAATEARGADGSVNAKAMRAAGGADLIGAVLRLVQRGRQAFVDRADVLLLKYADAVPAEGEVVVPAPEASAPEAPTTEAPAAAPLVLDTPVAADDATDDGAAPAAPAAQILPLPPRPAPQDAGRALLASAAARLAQAGTELAQAEAAEVTARAIKETTWLAEALDDMPDPALDGLRDVAWAAADMAQLLKLEAGDGAAADAAALMVQMRDLLPAEAWMQDATASWARAA